jgi:hypothetical protein
MALHDHGRMGHHENYGHESDQASTTRVLRRDGGRRIIEIAVGWHSVEHDATISTAIIAARPGDVS